MLSIDIPYGYFWGPLLVRMIKSIILHIFRILILIFFIFIWIISLFHLFVLFFLVSNMFFVKIAECSICQIIAYHFFRISYCLPLAEIFLKIVSIIGSFGLVGSAKSQVVNACRSAIKDNDIPRLIKTVINGGSDWFFWLF